VTIRRRLDRLEDLAPRGECRRPLVLGPPDIFPGERAEVEAWCREQAASPCLVGGGCRDCPEPAMRRWFVVTVVAEA
jgi:hypothetical protein